MKVSRQRRDQLVLITVALVLLLVAGWLSLPPSPPPGGIATSDYLSATRAFDEAVAAGDAGKAADWVSGNALIALRSQISTDSQAGLVIMTSRSPSRFDLLAGSGDANFVQVRDSGIERLDIAQAPGNAVIATRDRTYSRVASMTRNGTHYQLSEVSETSAPAGWLDQWGGWVVRLLLVALGAVLTVLAWARHRQVRALPSESQEPDEPARRAGVIESAPQRTMQCFGGLTISYDGEDLTPNLLARPVVAFIWMYLLALEIGRPGSRITRATLAAEIFAGLPAQTQRERLRDRLRDIRTALPPALAACVVQGNDAIGFDSSGWAVDAIELQTLARSGRTSILEAPRGGWVNFEQRWSGTLLQEWEELERVTEGRGVSHELISDLRLELESSLVDTLMAGSARLLTLGEAAASVRVAERAEAIRPDREDVRNGLARAYAQAGRHDAATESGG